MNVGHEPWMKKYGVIAMHAQRFAFGESTTHLELG